MRLTKHGRSYGLGELLVLVLDSVLVLLPDDGDEDVLLLLLLLDPEAGEEAVVVVLLVVELLLLEPPDGLPAGFTTVVLFSVLLPAGEAAGATVSVFCSQAAKSAVLARIQIYFFIGVWIE